MANVELTAFQVSYYPVLFWGRLTDYVNSYPLGHGHAFLPCIFYFLVSISLVSLGPQCLVGWILAAVNGYQRSYYFGLFFVNTPISSA